MKTTITLAKGIRHAFCGLLIIQCSLFAVAQTPTLQAVTDVTNGNYTTKNVWLGMSPGAGVTEQALNVGGRIKILGLTSTYTLGTDANQPTIYRSGINTGTYPFNNYDHLMLQAGIQNRDIILLTGSTPTPRLVVTGSGNVGIGTAVPEGKLDVYGAVFINTNANLNLKASAVSPSDPGDLVFLANNNTEYARVYTQPGGTALNFSVGSTPAPRMIIANTGSVGIGTLTPGSYKLAVEGTIGARKVKVTQAAWADFVFHQDYKLPSLQDVENYIKINQHLPEIPSAVEVEKEGLDIGEMNKKLLQKVEELTLYIIQLKKDSEAQMQMIQELQATIKK